MSYFPFPPFSSYFLNLVLVDEEDRRDFCCETPDMCFGSILLEHWMWRRGDYSW